MYNNPYNKQGLEFLDILTIIAFCAQMANMDGDVEQNNYIKQVINNINIEINKLHKENDIIMEQNEEIIQLLRKEN